MDIYITGMLPAGDSDSGSSVKLRIPVLPEEIKFSGAKKFAEYNILDSGSVIVPNGTETGTCSWESFLPGKGRKREPWLRGSWKNPKTIQNYFSVWKDKNVKLKLLITETPINRYVYLSDFSMTYSGAYGDYHYSITLKDAKMIEVQTAQVQEAPTPPQPSRQEPEPGKQYTVASGDTLWDISKKYYGSGSQYPKLYSANADVIEAAAKKHGKSSSGNGNWIYPGTVLSIP